ncbi:MAG: CinA family protein [Pseudomonadota bacterium]
MNTQSDKHEQLQDLVVELGILLVEQGKFLCTAESCTGGGIASELTSIAGSSAWFDCAFVTYSNRAKVSMLGVSEDSLAKHGAVSEPVALEMATGARARSGNDIALSVTGIAGPGGGSPEKPVGTVCLGWSDGSETAAVTVNFEGDRDAVRTASIRYALEQLITLLK